MGDALRVSIGADTGGARVVPYRRLSALGHEPRARSYAGVSMTELDIAVMW
jgi:hypothetical protein